MHRPWKKHKCEEEQNIEFTNSQQEVFVYDSQDQSVSHFVDVIEVIIIKMQIFQLL